MLSVNTQLSTCISYLVLGLLVHASCKLACRVARPSEPLRLYSVSSFSLSRVSCLSENQPPPSHDCPIAPLIVVSETRLASGLGSFIFLVCSHNPICPSSLANQHPSNSKVICPTTHLFFELRYHQQQSRLLVFHLRLSCALFCGALHRSASQHLAYSITSNTARNHPHSNQATTQLHNNLIRPIPTSPAAFTQRRTTKTNPSNNHTNKQKKRIEATSLTAPSNNIYRPSFLIAST